MALPQNAQAIYSFLVGQGLSPNAAAGVAGNIYQESQGNPESAGTGGRGLIGWTPPGTLPNSAFTGNTQKDLQAQLQQVMVYIKANGSVADINAHAATPKDAADWFSGHYERPGIPALANREGAANSVAAAAKSGNWQGSASITTSASLTSASGGLGGLLSFPSQITTFFSDANDFVKAIMWLAQPSSWIRIGAFIIGVALLLFAIHAFLAVGEGGDIFPKAPAIVPVPV